MQIKTGWAPVNGARLYYEMSGAGKPLLLIHAGVADSRMWDAQFVPLAERFQMLRYDMRGFGRSIMPSGSFSHYGDALALLDHLGVETAVLVGISFGSSVAVDAALAAPDRVQALVLGAPMAGIAPSERMRQFWRDEAAALAREEADTAVELNLRLWVDGPQRQPEQVDSAVRQQVAAMQRHIFEMTIPEDAEEMELEPEANGRLAEITVPTLVLAGKLDLPEVVEHARYLTDILANAQHTTIPDVAHMLNMEAPAQFNQLIMAFLHRQQQGQDQK